MKEIVEAVKKKGFYEILERARDAGYKVGVLITKCDEDKYVFKVAVLDIENERKYWSAEIDSDEMEALKRKYEIYVMRTKIERYE